MLCHDYKIVFAVSQIKKDCYICAQTQFDLTCLGILSCSDVVQDNNGQEVKVQLPAFVSAEC